MAGPVRTISLGTHQIVSPVLFASYRLSDFPTSGLKCLPWKMTGTQALLINAYDFCQRKHRNWLNNGWDPAKYLHFGDKPILIDSGAFYFLRDDRISITPGEILGMQLKSKADVGVVLDHPFPPDATDKSKRIATTIRNTEAILKQYKDSGTKMTLMAAIHGHSRRQIRGCIAKYRLLQDKYHVDLLGHVGIGSLAPLAQRGEATLAAEVIHHVRQELPSSQIHCFSMGSGLLMLLAFYCGADSVDSQSWIVSAGFKLAQLPGHYVVRMGKREYGSEEKYRAAMRKFRHRTAKLAAEDGYYAKDWVTGAKIDLTDAAERRAYVERLVDLKSNEHVHNRACHNLWTFNYEVKGYRKAISAGRVDEFVGSRLAGTRYEAAFRHAQALAKQRK